MSSHLSRKPDPIQEYSASLFMDDYSDDSVREKAKGLGNARICPHDVMVFDQCSCTKYNEATIAKKILLLRRRKIPIGSFPTKETGATAYASDSVPGSHCRYSEDGSFLLWEQGMHPTGWIVTRW